MTWTQRFCFSKSALVCQSLLRSIQKQHTQKPRDLYCLPYHVTGLRQSPESGSSPPTMESDLSQLGLVQGDLLHLRTPHVYPHSNCILFWLFDGFLSPSLSSFVPLQMELACLLQVCPVIDLNIVEARVSQVSRVFDVTSNYVENS